LLHQQQQHKEVWSGRERGEEIIDGGDDGGDDGAY